MKGQYWSLVLALRPFSVLAQTSVGSCEDLPTFIDEDIEVELTSAEISCSNFTEIVVTAGATLALSSTQTETMLENLRIEVESDSAFISFVPSLSWKSQRDTFVSGSALRIESDASATFSDNVTFRDGLSYDKYSHTGGVVSNSGTLTFSGAATFTDTLDGGAIVNDGGDITFEGDASFINNTFTYDDNSYEGSDGAGIRNLYGTLTFEGVAYFSGNEAVGERLFESEGIYTADGKGGGVYTRCSGDKEVSVLFKGEVTFLRNKARVGAAIYGSDCAVRFESLATFTDNEANSEGDDSSGGAAEMFGYGSFEFAGDLVATRNVARRGGAFFLDRLTNLTATGTVTITNNVARQSGGAIYNEGTLVLPAAANISDNGAISCPGILNSDNTFFDPVRRFTDPQAEVVFTGGESYTGNSVDLCYLGVPTIIESSPTAEVLDRDCDVVFSGSPMLGFYRYRVLDTRFVSSIDFDGAADAALICSEMLIVFVTGGGELTLTSSADSYIFSKLRFEVLGYTKLILDLPPATFTGFERSEFGGSIYIERGSSMDVVNTISFEGNTFRYLVDSALDERGGAAIHSQGDVKFYEKASFIGNGFYAPDASYAHSGPGGAVYNVGDMEFMKKATFRDNFIADGSNGGGMANFGTLIFNLRGIFRNNSVENGYNDDSEPLDGFGGGLYNGGDSATVLFKRLAIFQDNVGGFRGGALAAVASEELDDGEVAGNKITFEAEAKFRDNSFETSYGNTGGAALWVYGLAAVDFQDRAVFKRSVATNGAAIMNTGDVFFASSDLVTMDGNIASESCPDIKNFDKNLYDHGSDGVFGTVDDTNDVLWYEGTIHLGGEVFVGESAEICEFP